MDLDISKFPNGLDYIKMTTKDMRDQLSTMSLDFLYVGSNKGRYYEIDGREHSFIYSFYSLVNELGRIPTQEEVFKKSVERLKTDKGIGDNLSDPNFVLGWKRRAYVSFPSIVRDLYFNLLLKENGCNVIYNTKLDFDYKIDCLLIKDGQMYGIGMYADTHQGCNDRRHKMAMARSHGALFDNVKYVDLPIIEGKNVEYCGKFWLYTKYHVDEMLKLC